MVKVTLAKVRTKGQHYWDKEGTEYVCSGGPGIARKCASTGWS